MEIVAAPALIVLGHSPGVPCAPAAPGEPGGAWPAGAWPGGAWPGAGFGGGAWASARVPEAGREGADGAARRSMGAPGSAWSRVNPPRSFEPPAGVVMGRSLHPARSSCRVSTIVVHLGPR